MRTQRTEFGSFQVALAIALFGVVAIVPSASAQSTRSSSIALSANNTRLFNVNFEANSVTVFLVKNSGQTLEKLDEVGVGQEPVCIAARGLKAYVTNSASGTVSVIRRQGGSIRVVDQIEVGNEPRGCALSQSGDRLLVANHTDGTISIIDTSGDDVVGTVPVGGNPGAIAVEGDRVFVTDFYARLIPGRGEGFDDGKEGVVKTFTLSNPGSVTEITLSPLANSGFTANRSNFCNATRDPDPVNQTFCPDLTGGPGDPEIVSDPQGVFPNQLGSAVACGGRLYLPNIGAQPEPPVFFNVNVQALTYVVDTAALSERTDLHVNLNAQIATEPNPANPTASLGRLFGNDLVDIAAVNAACQSFLIVSRGGNFVLRAGLVGGKLDIGAPNNVVRFQTGNLPTGIAVHGNGRFAYANNLANLSVSILDLQSNTVVERDVEASTPPVPGSPKDSFLKGALAFFTALGIPDNGLSGLGIRDIVPLQFRGKQSSDAWSTCGSCHPFGLSDRVTWVFGDGPRNSIAMDGLYSKINGAHDIRINNWSAARDSPTDFNNNSRNVQCGKGFAGGDPPLNAAGNGACPSAGATPPNPAIFDHGISNGGSEALDVQTTWIQQAIRTLNMPKVDPAAIDAGAVVFGANCASCHGGAKWTKSQVFYLNNPSFVMGQARDPGLTISAAQVISYADAKVDPGTLSFLDPVGTFNAANPIEIRGQGNPGGTPFGVLGFNSPTMLGVNYSPPYFHDGAAQTLEEVFQIHLVEGQTIADLLGDPDEANLLAFLRSIDGRTNIFKSDGDIFKDPFQNLP